MTMTIRHPAERLLQYLDKDDQLEADIRSIESDTDFQDLLSGASDRASFGFASAMRILFVAIIFSLTFQSIYSYFAIRKIGSLSEVNATKTDRFDTRLSLVESEVSNMKADLATTKSKLELLESARLAASYDDPTQWVTNTGAGFVGNMWLHSQVYFVPGEGTQYLADTGPACGLSHAHATNAVVPRIILAAGEMLGPTAANAMNAIPVSCVTPSNAPRSVNFEPRKRAKGMVLGQAH
jgi:hypothetical protein